MPLLTASEVTRPHFSNSRLGTQTKPHSSWEGTADGCADGEVRNARAPWRLAAALSLSVTRLNVQNGKAKFQTTEGRCSMGEGLRRVTEM